MAENKYAGPTGKKAEKPLVVISRSEVIEEKTGKVTNTFESAAEIPTQSPNPPSPGTELNIDMYFAVKAIPVHHRPGMRVATKIRSASYEKWEEIFRSY